MDEVNEFLEHFGVRGMQWGVKKDRSRQGQANSAQARAERRPTRGNVRTAHRAQIRADRTVLGQQRRPITPRQARVGLAGATAVLGILAVAGGRQLGARMSSPRPTIDMSGIMNEYARQVTNSGS